MIKFQNYPLQRGEDVTFSLGTEAIIESLNPAAEEDNRRLFRVGEAAGLILHANMENPRRSAVREMTRALTHGWDWDDFDMAFLAGVERGMDNAESGLTTVVFKLFPFTSTDSPNYVAFGSGDRLDFTTADGVLDSQDAEAYPTSQVIGRLIYANMDNPTGDAISAIGASLAERWEGEPLPTDFQAMLDLGAQTEHAVTIGRTELPALGERIF